MCCIFDITEFASPACCVDILYSRSRLLGSISFKVLHGKKQDSLHLFSCMLAFPTGTYLLWRVFPFYIFEMLASTINNVKKQNNKPYLNKISFPFILNSIVIIPWV